MMPPDIAPLTTSQAIIQGCLFLVAVIAIVGGAQQFYLGSSSSSLST